MAGRALLSGAMVTLCLVFRKKTRADETGGTSSFVTQQRGLLPPALSPLLFPVGRRVCKCHRKGKGWCLKYNNNLLKHLVYTPIECSTSRWMITKLLNVQCFIRVRRDR